MQSPVPLTWWGVVGIIGAGFLVGWFVANSRSQDSANPQSWSPASPEIRTPTRPRSERILQVKCQCGAIWKFHDSSRGSAPGEQPLPTGDSYTCPQCGKTIDLAQARKLMAEALQSR